MMRAIYFRTSHAAEWQPYTEIISTKADAEKFARFIQSVIGCETKVEDEHGNQETESKKSA